MGGTIYLDEIAGDIATGNIKAFSEVCQCVTRIDRAYVGDTVSRVDDNTSHQALKVKYCKGYSKVNNSGESFNK